MKKIAFFIVFLCFFYYGQSNKLIGKSNKLIGKSNKLITNINNNLNLSLKIDEIIQHHPYINVKNNINCKLCTDTVTFINNYLNTHTNVTILENDLYNYCEKLSDDYVNECKGMVNSYLPLIITYLENHMEPKEICIWMKYC